MYQVYLGLGGNIGNKRENLKKVLFYIENELGTIVKKSSVYETPPWGFNAEENFWNMVVHITTNLEPDILLQKTKEIEQKFGRKKSEKKYYSRQMDIDILYIDDIILKNKLLKLPHPLIEDRLFVLVPLEEIAPDKVHPVLKQTSRQLLENCPDDSEIKKVDFNFAKNEKLS